MNSKSSSLQNAERAEVTLSRRLFVKPAADYSERNGSRIAGIAFSDTDLAPAGLS
jgi:hypothetical protein